MPYRKSLIMLILVVGFALPASAYTIYLTDGSKIIAQGKYTVDGEKAIIVLESGTQTFLALEEIDVERTDKANENNSIGTALIFEDGRFVERADVATTKVEIDTVTDLIARGGATIRESSSGAPSDSDAGTALEPLSNSEVATALQTAFREQGVTGVGIFQGSTRQSARLELTTESESSIFRGLEAAAAVLLNLAPEHSELCNRFEISMLSSESERGGDFELTPELAEAIGSKTIELSAFFVEHVRF